MAGQGPGNQAEQELKQRFDDHMLYFVDDLQRIYMNNPDERDAIIDFIDKRAAGVKREYKSPAAEIGAAGPGMVPPPPGMAPPPPPPGAPPPPPAAPAMGQAQKKSKVTAEDQASLDAARAGVAAIADQFLAQPENKPDQGTPAQFNRRLTNLRGELEKTFPLRVSPEYIETVREFWKQFDDVTGGASVHDAAITARHPKMGNFAAAMLKVRDDLPPFTQEEAFNRGEVTYEQLSKLRMYNDELLTLMTAFEGPFAELANAETQDLKSKIAYFTGVPAVGEKKRIVGTIEALENNTILDKRVPGSKHIAVQKAKAELLDLQNQLQPITERIKKDQDSIKDLLEHKNNTGKLKKGHSNAFAIAAESMGVIDERQIKVEKAKEREAFQFTQEHRDQLNALLRSLLSDDDIKERLAGYLVATGDSAEVIASHPDLMVATLVDIITNDDKQKGVPLSLQEFASIAEGYYSRKPGVSFQKINPFPSKGGLIKDDQRRDAAVNLLEIINSELAFSKDLYLSSAAAIDPNAPEEAPRAGALLDQIAARVQADEGRPQAGRAAPAAPGKAPAGPGKAPAQAAPPTTPGEPILTGKKGFTKKQIERGEGSAADAEALERAAIALGKQEADD